MRSPAAANGRANRVTKARAGLGCKKYNIALIEATKNVEDIGALLRAQPASSIRFRSALAR
jgi:hypothetical protein